MHRTLAAPALGEAQRAVPGEGQAQPGEVGEKDGYSFDPFPAQVGGTARLCNFVPTLVKSGVIRMTREKILQTHPIWRVPIKQKRGRICAPVQPL
jgi:hypothetical protein